MKLSVLWALVVAVVLVQAVGAAPAPDPAEALSCRVVGIQVVGETGADPEEWAWMMMPFGEEAGTALVLAVASSNPQVVPLAAKVTGLRSFRDSTGADLAAVEPDEGDLELSAMDARLRQRVPRGVRLADVRATRVPSAGSESIKVEGTVTTFVGLRPAKARQDAVSLQKGTKITAGPVPFEIVEVTFPEAAEAPKADGEATGRATVATDMNGLVGDINWAFGLDEPSVIFEDEFAPGVFGEGRGEAAMTITLEASGERGKIAAIELLDLAGKPVEWTSQGSSFTMIDPAGRGTVTRVRVGIGLPEKLDTVSVVVHYWGEVRKVDMPFSVECGVAVESIAGQ